MRVAIIGVGMTKFGEVWDKSYRQLFVEAGIEAIKDAGIDPNDIEAIYGGSMTPGQFINQEHVASLVADQAGLENIPAVRVEAACASGSLALRQAYLAIKAGEYDLVLVGGVEKMTDILTPQAVGALASAADQEWEGFYGVTFPGLYAMMARRHMYEYGTTEEQLAMVAVKNHHNGAKNPKAQFRFEITVDQVLNSPMVAEPLKLLDCSPITDGAAAVILANEKTAKEYTDTPIWILGSGHATDTIALHDRKSLTRLDATIIAAKQAYKQAKIKPKDVDIAEVHDCFTIAEIMAIEDLGFVGKGEGGKAVEEGMTSLNGELPVNTSGGLKACGHPVGATGVKQVVEIALQLRNEAGKRQVKDVEIGLTHNVGGSGGTAVVHIFSM